MSVDPWGERVPTEHAVRGIHSTTLGSNSPSVAGADGVETEGLDAETTDLAREPTPGTVVDLYAPDER
ncbi:MAG: hypothetical protein ACOCQL_02325 [Halolamina sp.]